MDPQILQQLQVAAALIHSSQIGIRNIYSTLSNSNNKIRATSSPTLSFDELQLQMTGYIYNTNYQLIEQNSSNSQINPTNNTYGKKTSTPKAIENKTTGTAGSNNDKSTEINATVKTCVKNKELPNGIKTLRNRRKRHKKMLKRKMADNLLSLIANAQNVCTEIQPSKSECEDPPIQFNSNDNTKTSEICNPITSLLTTNLTKPNTQVTTNKSQLFKLPAPEHKQPPSNSNAMTMNLTKTAAKVTKTNKPHLFNPHTSELERPELNSDETYRNPRMTTNPTETSEVKKFKPPECSKLVDKTRNEQIKLTLYSAKTNTQTNAERKKGKLKNVVGTTTKSQKETASTELVPNRKRERQIKRVTKKNPALLTPKDRTESKTNELHECKKQLKRKANAISTESAAYETQLKLRTRTILPTLSSTPTTLIRCKNTHFNTSGNYISSVVINEPHRFNPPICSKLRLNSSEHNTSVVNCNDKEQKEKLCPEKAFISLLDEADVTIAEKTDFSRMEKQFDLLLEEALAEKTVDCLLEEVLATVNQTIPLQNEKKSVTINLSSNTINKIESSMVNIKTNTITSATCNEMVQKSNTFNVPKLVSKTNNPSDSESSIFSGDTVVLSSNENNHELESSLRTNDLRTLVQRNTINSECGLESASSSTRSDENSLRTNQKRYRTRRGKRRREIAVQNRFKSKPEMEFLNFI